MTAVLGLVFALAAGLAVSAEGNMLESLDGENSTAIKATYSEETPEPATVYYVDVQWGSLEYTYHSGNGMTWNPSTLLYEETTGEGAWSCEENADMITVTNHSNAGITASFTYTEANDSKISGGFDKTIIYLSSAEEGKAGPSDSAKLSLQGALDSTAAEKTVVGEVTVKISGGKAATATIKRYSGTGVSQLDILETD